MFTRASAPLGVPVDTIICARTTPEFTRGANRSGISLSAVGVRALTAAAAVARNEVVFAAVPDLGIDPDAISTGIRQARDR